MFSLVLSDHATTVARAYGLGAPVREMIMVARGEQGRVWRLDTDTGGFAIKELVIRQTPDDAAADVACQEAMLASSAVPMPRPIRTVAGQVLVDVAGYQVRAYEWVDLLAMDTELDRRWSERHWRPFIRCTTRPRARSSAGSPIPSGRNGGPSCWTTRRQQPPHLPKLSTRRSPSCCAWKP
jgi:hypothetical protein